MLECHGRNQLIRVGGDLSSDPVRGCKDPLGGSCDQIHPFLYGETTDKASVSESGGYLATHTKQVELDANLSDGHAPLSHRAGTGAPSPRAQGRKLSSSALQHGRIGEMAGGSDQLIDRELDVVAIFGIVGKDRRTAPRGVGH